MKNRIFTRAASFLFLCMLIPSLLFATVADNYTPVKTLGNGTTVNFSFGFALIASGNERVYLESVATGVQTLQTIGTNYTIVFNDKTPGGTVTFITPPTSAYYVIIGREVEKTQEVPLTTSSGFQAKVVEGMVDKLTTQIQDLQEQLDRSIKVAIGATVPSDYLADAQAAATAAQVAQTAAETAKTNAEAAEAAAEAAAASVPNIVNGTFTNASLTAGVLTITHNKSLAAPYAITVMIFDNNGKQIIPDQVTGAANTVAVDLTSFGTLTGTWGYRVI